MTISGSNVAGNTATNYGAGIFNNGGRITISDSVISGNTAADGGGGVYSDGVIAISDSAISGNSGYHVGGIERTGGPAEVLSHWLIVAFPIT